MNKHVESTTEVKLILVVEDDPAIQEFIALALSTLLEYQVRLVSHGYEALNVLHECTPRLFLIDYQLPSMTGLQLYDQLHRMRRFERIPTIIMSANLPLAELEKRQLVGLRKPFSLDELLQSVEYAIAQG